MTRSLPTKVLTGYVNNLRDLDGVKIEETANRVEVTLGDKLVIRAMRPPGASSGAWLTILRDVPGVIAFQ